MRNKLCVVFAVVFNLSILGYFKYANFFIENINYGLNTPIMQFKGVVLPIGISFYTFQALSYVIDVYRGAVTAARNPIKLALYISFFPQLIAGPIVKYHDIAIQLDKHPLTGTKLAYGIKRFIYGLSKKVLIANTLALTADNIFSCTQVDVKLAWIGILCYSLQIYFDFSGYSDMAIGLGHMFGFRFQENFEYPYTAKSIREFWHRWHISLSTWFREYLYIPLGGSRCSPFRVYSNLLLVFLATGFWHGASWNFIIWGMIHGFFIVLERLGLNKLLDKPRAAFFAHVYTLGVVVFAWVFFRAETLPQAVSYVQALFRSHSEIPYDLREFLAPGAYLAIAAGILLCGPVQRIFPAYKEWLFQEHRNGIVQIFLLYCLLVASIFLLVAGTYNPFIYFRF